MHTMSSGEGSQYRGCSGGGSLEPINGNASSNSSLLDKTAASFDSVECLPRGWPISPKPIKLSVWAVATDLAVDVVLLATSAAFFVFGVTVKRYDKASVEEHQSLSDTLETVAKYVRAPNDYSYTSSQLIPP